MQVKINAVVFAIEFEESSDVKKTASAKVKLLLSKKDRSLVACDYDTSLSIRDSIGYKLVDVLGTERYHLEQVHTFGEKKYFDLDQSLDIVYLSVTNMKNIVTLHEDFEFVDFCWDTFGEMFVEDKTYKYVTNQERYVNNVVFTHSFEGVEVLEEKKLIEILSAYKQLKTKIEFTDILYKMLPQYFSLEDVRIVYSKITLKEVDKSNFRKRIMPFVDATNKTKADVGYRPTKLYEYKNKNIVNWI